MRTGLDEGSRGRIGPRNGARDKLRCPLTLLLVLLVAVLPAAADPGPVERPLPAGEVPARPGDGDDTLADGPLFVEEGGLRLRVDVLKGLQRPWALAFLPDGAMLVTERPGRLRRVRVDFSLDPQPVTGVPEVLASAYKGLMDVALHPDFEDNGWVYLTYAKRLPGESDEDWDLLTGPAATVALARGRYDGAHTLSEVEDLFVADAATSGVSAARMVFARDGTLFLGIGAAGYLTSEGGKNRVGSAHEAQDPMSHTGKILRLTDDGAVPADNPFVTNAAYRPEIFALGVRNPTGLILHPQTGEPWIVDHGPLGGDELNVIRAGANYGWPLVSYGRAYSGRRTGDGSGPVLPRSWVPGMEEPLLTWSPNIAPGGLAIYGGDAFPSWRGHALVGGLAGRQLHRVALTEERLPTEQESLLLSLGQRIREVRVGPDGRVYLLTDHDRGALLRMAPAGG